MFSEAIVQEIVALLIAAVALVYLSHKIAGWPRFSKKPKNEAPVVVGERLARGLKSSVKRMTDAPSHRHENAGDPNSAQ